MASTMHEQILENVRRGVVLPIHRDAAPTVNSDPTNPEFNEAEFQRIVSGAVDLVRRRPDVDSREALEELVQAFRDAGLPVSMPDSSESQKTDSPSADSRLFDRLFHALDKLAAATRDGEVRDREILQRLDAVAGRVERVARTAASPPAPVVASTPSPKTPEAEPEVTSNQPARVPLDDIQGMIEFLR